MSELPKHKQYLRDIGKRRCELTKKEMTIYCRYLREPHKEHIAKRSAKWRDANREHARKLCRDHYYRNKKRYLEVGQSLKERYPERYKLRGWLTIAMSRIDKDKTDWVENVGCTKDEFKAHIESQFVEGMTWGNWSKHGWHLDHIIPLSKGGTNHYTNLQPLWAKDNWSKSDKLV